MIALHAISATQRDAEPTAAHEIRVALAGNPNAGKTSIFNALTGARQRVGNYPGVTVEKRSGHYEDDGRKVELCDLPGAYSLSSSSAEERIAQQELLGGSYDAVVVVVDSTTLKRSLVLLSQIMQMGARCVLCLNMADEAAAAGQQLDLAQMRALLGMPIVQTVGHRADGIDALRSAIDDALRASPEPERVVLGERLERALADIGGELDGEATGEGSHRWVALRLLVGDDVVAEHLEAQGIDTAAAKAEAAGWRRRIEAETGLDVALFVTERTFGFVDGLLREVVVVRARADARAWSDRVDSVLAHRALGLPIFAAIMYGVFWITFTLGEAPMAWIEAAFEALAAWVSGLWPVGASSALQSLLVDGVIAGVGGVMVFLPNILLLFCGLALLEDTGYMARAAFLMDRLMHRFGLHGKSFLPMMTGFGCSVPGIMATRTLDSERDRLTTMMVLPLMSCGARLPIWMLLIPAFFAPPWRAPMLWVIYAVGIVLALVLALLLRRSVFKGDDAPFVMELPPYRVPTLRGVGMKMLDRGWLYVRKAGTIILGLSILMWVLTAYPKTESFALDEAIAAGQVAVVEDEAPERDTQAAQGVEVITAEQAEARRAGEALEKSAAGRIGRALEPVVAPLGFDWKIGTGLIGALAAKEVFVAQMGIVYSLGEADEESFELRSVLRRDYSPLVGLSLMLFLLISAPCIATIALTRRESGSWRWALLQFGGLSAIAYLVALVVFQVGRALGFA
ncbi:MAG: ferrous iron transport protein B [Deltaproteobacteria bacterium]|jgi:ferrous iron transport protein B|nr:ferrous iron transport protein B [Deltaproteobacteria bacterium]MBW2532109.1 ferrous iron transport protein B [Deltaproteobacteria bacterium]